MSKSDLPYIVLVAVFGLAIFVAGRMSAPDAKVVREIVPATVPSIVVITSTSEPPMALLPDPAVTQEPETVSPAAKKQLLPPATATSVASIGPAAPEPVFLEETPELPMNPYKKDR